MTQTESTTSPDLTYVPIITRELLARMLKHVSIWCWPVLFLNLLSIRNWAKRVDYAGDGYIAVRFSRFGEIQLKWGGQVFLQDGPQVDASPLAALPSWTALQTKLLSTYRTKLSADPSEGWGPWTSICAAMRWLKASPWIPACAGIFGAWGWCGKKLEPG